MFKLDKFTWAVIIVVVLVLAAAVVTVNLTGGDGWGQATYLDEDTPEAVVHNAFVAFMNQDFTQISQYFSAAVVAENERSGTVRGGWDAYYPDNTNRRLRIKSVDPVNDDEVMVAVIIDHYYSGGLFGGGNTWSDERALRVIREGGAWKIDTYEFFY